MIPILSAGLLLLAAAISGCKRSSGGGWSADEMHEFFELCSPGQKDALCQCLATELPPLMTFADYKGVRAASQFVPGAKLDDAALAKMAHAATACASHVRIVP